MPPQNYPDTAESGETYDVEQSATCARCPSFADGTARIAIGKNLGNGELMLAIITLPLCSKCHDELKVIERNPELLRDIVGV